MQSYGQGDAATLQFDRTVEALTGTLGSLQTCITTNAQQCSMLCDTQLEVLAWRMQISWWTQPLSRCKALSATNTAMSLR